MTVCHRDDASLMKPKDEPEFFLIGDRADELLTASAGKPEYVFDSMRRRYFQIGPRGRFLISGRISHSCVSPYSMSSCTTEHLVGSRASAIFGFR